MRKMRLGKICKGDVVVIPFPFSDWTQAKRHPALVIAVVPGDDVILRQITSRTVADQFAIAIEMDDFSTGSLNQVSNVPIGYSQLIGKLFCTKWDN